MYFVHYCKKNGIDFTYVVDKTLVFLDLELSYDSSGKIGYKTHFKPTSGNSYVHADSAHHKKWLANIPDGQFRGYERLAVMSRIMQLGEILKQNFLDKRYKQSDIDRVFQKHMEVPKKKEKDSSPTTQYKVSFCTQYNERGERN